MKLKVRLKSFAEIASIAVPELQYDDVSRGNFIVLKNLAYRNFNTPTGKYNYDPYWMLPLEGKEFIVDTDFYPNGYLYETDEYQICFGKWMIDIIGKVND